MNAVLQSRWLPIVLLVASNVFMTVAWYGHLKHKGQPLWLAIFVSWGIAFLEYCLMVPANRWGHAHYSATQLKIIQEVITLTVFSGFVVIYLGERLRWNHLAAFICIIAAVGFTFLPAEFNPRRPLDLFRNRPSAEPAATVPNSNSADRTNE